MLSYPVSNDFCQNITFFSIMLITAKNETPPIALIIMAANIVEVSK